LNSPAEFLHLATPPILVSCIGILPSVNVTVKVAAKAKDEKNNANKIKNALGLSVLVKINLLNFLNCFNIFT
jgi:hypothetical protein